MRWRGYEAAGRAGNYIPRTFARFQLSVHAPLVSHRTQSRLPQRGIYRMKSLLCLAFLPLFACSHDQPGVEIRMVEVVKEVQRPCPGEKPARPTPLPRPLPTDAVQLAALLGAKLAEWSAPGMYGDKADALMERCLRP